MPGRTSHHPATLQRKPSSRLDEPELARYNRHLILPEFGEDAQRRLKSARVLLVGAGGLGSPAALYLAAAGVGVLGLVDSDAVELANLQRQVLHGTSDVGRRKTDSARQRLAEINPHVHVETHDVRLDSDNALGILADYDVIVDGSDNFPTRYLVNDACVLLGKPNVYGSVIRFEGQASIFHHEDGPCYRCLFREPPPPGLVPSCEEGGVLGVLPGIIGSIQAVECLKLIAQVGDVLSGRLLLLDALRMRFHTITIRRDPECPACGTREITELIDYEEFCGLRGDGESAPSAESGIGSIEPAELTHLLAQSAPVQLIDVREPYEWRIARIAGARLVPLGELESRLDELDSTADTVVYCHHGIRSAQAAAMLSRAGFSAVRNLSGGIARWSREVDPGVPTY